jgi:dolichol-phosphate mannosyltransferase
VNRGVAEAFRTGITYVAKEAADDDVVVIMEGDGTSSPELLPTMAEKIRGGADIVIASRYQHGGIYKDFPIKRYILSQGANIVFRLLFPMRGVRDYSIFYRAYRARCLKKALARHGQDFITVQTFFANIEILFRLRPFVKRVEEVPLVYDYGKKQGKSGMKIGKNLRSYILFIAKHGFRGTPHD